MSDEKTKPRMTFLEALKTGRPMRRDDTNYEKPWLFLGYEHTLPLGTFEIITSTVTTSGHRWRDIQNGNPTGLSKEDYLADDWEVMP